MLSSSQAVWMTLLVKALYSLDVVAICSSLSWSPAALFAVVLIDWHAALRFLGFLCSTSLACRARAGRTVVAMTCGGTLLAPGTPLSMRLLAGLGGKQFAPVPAI